jgi:hypothetical protein
MDSGSVTHPEAPNNPAQGETDDRPTADAPGPVIEGTVVEEPQAPAASTALAVVDGAAGAVIRAEQPEEILAKAHQIARPLANLIEQAGLAKNLGGNRKHVEVGGWQAAGTMLGALGGQALHAETVWTRIVRDPASGEPLRRSVRITKQGSTAEFDGYDWEACVEVRTPAGVVVGRAEAMCSRTEKTWANRDDYAVRSMAETRAESRAYRRAIGWVVHLAGYNPTPAEEIPESEQGIQLNDWQIAALEQAEPMGEGAQRDLARKLAVLVGAENDAEKVDAMKALWKALCAVTGTKRPSLGTAAAVSAIVDTYCGLYPQAAERLQPPPAAEPEAQAAA